MSKRALQAARERNHPFSVEVHLGDRVLRRYQAPFETAARALAKEVTRRLQPEGGVRVIVGGPAGPVAAWSVAHGSWQPERMPRGQRPPAEQLSLFVAASPPGRKLLAS